jgi:hypothetical protein
MPNAQTPDGVLSGSGWMQQQSSQMVIVLGGRITLSTLPRYVLCTTSSAWHLHLPAASSVSPFASTTLKKIDSTANAVTINPAGSDLIEGVSSWHLATPMDYFTLVSDGVSNWYVAREQGISSIRTVRGIGANYTVPSSAVTQPALCVTLADVIAILKGCGLCAAS